MKRLADLWLWGSFAAFILLSVAAAARVLYPLDLWMLRVAQSRTSRLLDAIGTSFSVPGEAELAGAAMLVLAGGLFLAGRRTLAGYLLLAFLATGLLEFAMKLWLPTPPVTPEMARSTDPSPILDVSYPYPYPSGHMLRAVLLFGAVYFLWPRYLLRAGVIVVLVGVAVSRVYLGVHWTSDVVGGALLGVAGLAWAFKRETSGYRSQASGKYQ